jgi:phosphatidylglycerophosphatase A
MQPSARLLLSHPTHFISLGFGSGLAPKGPGTAGTLAAWLLYPLLRAAMSDFLLLAFLAGAFLFGIVAAERTGRALGAADHGAIVWDEMVAFWLVLLFTPPGLLWQAVAFGLFRLFDIVKPQPIRWADARVKGGFGVMLDDLLAAAYSLLALAGLVRLFGA